MYNLMSAISHNVQFIVYIVQLFHSVQVTIYCGQCANYIAQCAMYEDKLPWACEQCAAKWPRHSLNTRSDHVGAHLLTMCW